MAREFGDNNARGAPSRKRSKSEQGQRGDAHFAENITRLSAQDVEQLCELGTCIKRDANQAKKSPAEGLP
jgi:hypothetical protein